MVTRTWIKMIMRTTWPVSLVLSLINTRLQLLFPVSSVMKTDLHTLSVNGMTVGRIGEAGIAND